MVPPLPGWTELPPESPLLGPPPWLEPWFWDVPPSLFVTELVLEPWCAVAWSTAMAPMPTTAKLPTVTAAVMFAAILSPLIRVARAGFHHDLAVVQRDDLCDEGQANPVVARSTNAASYRTWRGETFENTWRRAGGEPCAIVSDLNACLACPGADVDVDHGPGMIQGVGNMGGEHAREGCRRSLHHDRLGSPRLLQRDGLLFCLGRNQGDGISGNTDQFRHGMVNGSAGVGRYQQVVEDSRQQP